MVFVLSLTTLIGFLGLVMDGGQAFHSRRNMQNAADAAALAGTFVFMQNRFQPNYPSAYQQLAIKEAQRAAELNGAPDPDGVPNDGINAALTITPVDVYGSTTQTGWGDSRLRGLKVDVAVGYETYFIRVVGITNYQVKTTATAVWGYTMSIRGLIPMAVNNDAIVASGLQPPNYSIVPAREYKVQLSPAGGGSGSQNYGTFTITGQTLADAWLNGLSNLIELGKLYPANDIRTITQITCDALRSRINSASTETWNNFGPNSPRVAVVAVIDGDVGGPQVRPIGYATIFIDAVDCGAGQMVTLHFVNAPILPNGTTIDPTIVNPPQYTPAVMKLID